MPPPTGRASAENPLSAPAPPRQCRACTPASPVSKAGREDWSASCLCYSALGALIALELFASIRRAPLFCLPFFDDVAERLGAFRRVLPLLPFCIPLDLRALHDLLLLANRLDEPRQKCLVVA